MKHWFYLFYLMYKWQYSSHQVKQSNHKRHLPLPWHIVVKDDN